MSRTARFAIMAGIAAASFVAGTWYSHRPQVAHAGSGARRILYYHDPMHPSYKSDKPGIAPDCGMQLEPVYEDAGAPGPEAASQPAGTVAISPERQQLIGIRTEPATPARGTYTIRVPGRVALDETRLFRIAAAVDGWVRSAAPIAAGSIVRKDELLATFYTRDFLTAQQTYLYALNTLDRFKDNESADQLKLTQAQVQAAEDNLEFLGMGKTQLAEIARSRRVSREIQLRSPVSGIVVARNVFPGSRFDRGTELFRVAGLEHVWVYADVFGNDARYLRAARGARVVLPGQAQALSASLSAALPQFDAASRTLKVRLELDNPGYLLRPDMFVDVEFPVAPPAALTVPADAVVDSGRTKTVYVERGNGYFEPREVELAWRLGGRAAIAKGLAAGERVVVAATFLIDSESRMKLAAAGRAKDPYCGMEVDPAGARAQADYQGRTYSFCSDACRRAFESNPAKYAAR